MTLIPIIQIDSSKARNLDISIDLQKIYYQPSGYQRTAKKLHEASLKAGFDFSLNEVCDWLERQVIHQVHMPYPRNIPSASFINITIPMWVIQADLCYMPYDQIGNKIYKFALNCVDIATRTKWTYPLTKRDSASVGIGLEKLFNSQKCPLTWPKKDLMVDGGVEFRGDVIRLMNKYGINILIANSKESMGIVEKFNKTLQEWSSIIQDAVDMRLPISERCRAWIRNLPIFLENLDNSVTRLLGISSANARKLKHVYAKSSKPRNGPMGFDEK
jgi:hypothetical protein